MTSYNYPTDPVSRKAALKATPVLPWVLSDDGSVVNPDGSKPSNHILQRVRFTAAQIKLELKKRTPQLKMKIINHAGSYHLQSKSGEIHSSRYPTRDAAHLAAIKMARGLIHFNPTVNRINASTNYSNKL